MKLQLHCCNFISAKKSAKFESKLKLIKLGSNLAENSAEISAKFESKLKRIKLGSNLAENSAEILQLQLQVATSTST